jgi:hypothetical protein
LKGEFEKKKTKLQKLETKRTRIKSKSKTNWVAALKIYKVDKKTKEERE